MANAAFAAQLDPSYPLGAVSPPPHHPLPHSGGIDGSHYVLSTPGGHRLPQNFHHPQPHRRVQNGVKNLDDDDIDDDSDDDGQVNDGHLMMSLATAEDQCYVRFV